MTKVEAKDLLDNLIGMVEDSHNADYDTALKMGIDALEEQKTGHKTCYKMCDRWMNKWIPCSERLPNDDGWYLCTIKNDAETRVAQIQYFEDIKWKAHGWQVIAWMDEPEPYKAESEDKE